MSKHAVVICNLGGPASISELRTFLFNLFSDKRILPVNKVLRFFLAKFISRVRYKKSAECYAKIGGKSPILEETAKQVVLMEQKLKELNKKDDFKVFMYMRHSFPKLQNIVNDINEFNPVKITLLPLYPHFSFSTTLSAFDEWDEISSKYWNGINVQEICCYFDDPDFIDVHSNLILKCYNEVLKTKPKVRVIFSAHSIPLSFIENGDPYQKQINKSVQLILSSIKIKDLDYSISYQSKIGPVKWLEPSTNEEILKAIKDNVPILVVPISFVSENLESLYELDILYKNIMPNGMFFRVPTLGDSEDFISLLVKMVSSDECVRYRKPNSVCAKNCNECKLGGDFSAKPHM